MADLLRFCGLTKTFPGVRALSDVSFDVPFGSVHALCGENGAGKSTLLRLLSGVYTPNSGQIEIDGKPLDLSSPSSAFAHGISVIYQELHLVPHLSVAENLLLGHMPGRFGLLRRQALGMAARRLLDRVGLDVDPWVELGTLSIAHRQMVEIAKALGRDAKVVAFDEPTSSLSSAEVVKLMEVIRSLREEGRAILYVSHRMDEISAICDGATVLRDGSHVITFPSLEGVTTNDIVSHMVGRDVEVHPPAKRSTSTTRLEVTDVVAPGLTQPISLDVKAGEIVGIFGLMGAGRTELFKAIFGASNRSKGSVMVDGQTVRSPQDALRKGLGFCSEDRKKEGIFPIASVQENTNIVAREQHTRLRYFVNPTWEKVNARTQAANLSVKTPSLSQPIRLLSGGNQQKVILGRWLSKPLSVLLLDEPTRGIDIGAKDEIYKILGDLADQGVAILMVSSELPELLSQCDRILVMRGGQLVAEVPREDANESLLLGYALPEVG